MRAKDWIISFLVSRAGGIFTPIIAAVVGMAVAKLAAFSPELASSVDQAAVATFVWGLILAWVNAWTNKRTTENVKPIQAMVNVPQDGVFGPVTWTEVRKAIPVAPDDRTTTN
jgi:uncharacterized membrane protein